MKTKILTFLTSLAVFFIPCQMVSASSVTFTNFSYTTRPYVESLQKITTKSKDDNEQRWYTTLTNSTGLGSTNSTARALLTSNTSSSSLELISPLVPIYSSTTSFNIGYYEPINAGTTCSLYLTGSGDNGNIYSGYLSGRYTS